MIRLLQWLFSSMSLERKCLLLFFSALLVLMSSLFSLFKRWATARQKTTCQRAIDHSVHELFLIHSNTLWKTTAIANSVQ